MDLAPVRPMKLGTAAALALSTGKNESCHTIKNGATLDAEYLKKFFPRKREVLVI